MGDPGLPEVAQRLQGYRQAHADAGRLVDAQLLRTLPFVTERVAPDFEALQAQGINFDAVFAASDLLAMAAIRTLRRLGRSVPDDVAVVGYDNIALAKHFHPPLSTVAQPIGDAGRALVALLLAQRAGERVPSRLLTTALVVRQSSRR